MHKSTSNYYSWNVQIILRRLWSRRWFSRYITGFWQSLAWGFCFGDYTNYLRKPVLWKVTRKETRSSASFWETLGRSYYRVEITPSQFIREWNGLAQSCFNYFKRGLAVSLTMTLSFYCTFLLDISYVSLKVVWILGPDSWCGRKPWRTYRKCVVTSLYCCALYLINWMF